MAGKPKPARVKLWRGTHYLFYTDHTTGKQMRRTCESLGAHNATQRRELEQQQRATERQQAAEVIVHGGRVTGDAVLVDDVADYLKDCQRRVETREANPEVRAGLSPVSLVSMTATIEHFKDWLEASKLTELKSKDLNGSLLTGYVDHVVKEDTRLGNRRKKRSAATVNLYLRNLKACLRWIHRLTPRRFRDFESVIEPLKPVKGRAKPRSAYSPDELAGFVSTALKREDPELVRVVKHRKGTRKRRVYEQPAFSTAATPVSRLFLLLALTGCRLGEALALKWEDVDLDRGRITFHAEKTGMVRWIPLAGASEGEIAPRFAKLLECWWNEAAEEADDPVFVLPHGDLDEPSFPKTAWQVTNKQAELGRIGPQRLRQNFTSYAASLGIPAAVAAMWQGHSADVAERHYRAQVLDRNKDAESFEEAMGLRELIDDLIAASPYDVD